MTATTTHSALVTFPADTQILITRDFNAPRHLVYRAHVDPTWSSGGGPANGVWSTRPRSTCASGVAGAT